VVGGVVTQEKTKTRVFRHVWLVGYLACFFSTRFITLPHRGLERLRSYLCSMDWIGSSRELFSYRCRGKAEPTVVGGEEEPRDTYLSDWTAWLEKERISASTKSGYNWIGISGWTFLFVTPPLFWSPPSLMSRVQEERKRGDVSLCHYGAHVPGGLCQWTTVEEDEGNEDFMTVCIMKEESQWLSSLGQFWRRLVGLSLLCHP
jgi:hypothetical protein